jgi:hypothetical protein
MILHNNDGRYQRTAGRATSNRGRFS